VDKKTGIKLDLQFVGVDGKVFKKMVDALPFKDILEEVYSNILECDKGIKHFEFVVTEEKDGAKVSIQLLEDELGLVKQFVGPIMEGADKIIEGNKEQSIELEFGTQSSITNAVKENLTFLDMLRNCRFKFVSRLCYEVKNNLAPFFKEMLYRRERETLRNVLLFFPLQMNMKVKLDTALLGSPEIKEEFGFSIKDLRDKVNEVMDNLQRMLGEFDKSKLLAKLKQIKVNFDGILAKASMNFKIDGFFK